MVPPNQPLPPVIYGFPEEWVDFQRRNPHFLLHFSNLDKAINTTFQRVHEKTALWQRMVYFLGRLAVEEFMEILLLCGNGYGIGAQKLLRGMYERAVTSNYLFKHPDEAKDFQDYSRITDYRLLESLRASGAGDIISKELAGAIEADYGQVKTRFTVTACKKCDTTRINHSWNKKDLVSMARESDSLWALLPYAYQVPTRELHSTMNSIFSRLDDEAISNSEGLIFDSSAQRAKADSTLRVAHLVLLSVLNVQKECFNIAELEPLLKICMEDVSSTPKS